MDKEKVLLTPEEIKQAAFISRNCSEPQERDKAQCRKLLSWLHAECTEAHGWSPCHYATHGNCPNCMAQVEEALK
jgi:hypothetical protein